MPVIPPSPGVSIEEIPSGPRVITGVATSITAFVGTALRGPVDEPIRCVSWSDFERTCGGLWAGSDLGYSVHQFFLNGGAQAIISRVTAGATAATLSIPGTGAGISTWSPRRRAPGAPIFAPVSTTAQRSGSERSPIPTPFT